MSLPGPATDELIGREAELATTTRMLERRVRLLTLTGPPGVGKTRLAQALMARCQAEYADGAVFVDLSSARDRVGAIGELSRALGAGGTTGERTGVRAHQLLIDREMLVVLDNAERVLDLAPELVTILRDCPKVRLLVTSRENMHLSQEHEFSVPPLAMPAYEDAHDVAKLASSPAVAVFVAAARSVRPDFAVTEENATAIAEICIRLDGLPLALNLAAVRVKMFSATEIAARLRDRRALLEATSHDVPARHRTLRAAISWSHAVLSDAERRVFRRLAVFTGSWTLDAAQTVCGEQDLDVIEALSSLIDKSLVQRGDALEEHVSFSLLESLREYANEQLDHFGERDAIAARHAGYCMVHARSAEQSLGSSTEGAFWTWSNRHEGDMRSALDWCMTSGDVDGALVLATGLCWSWYTRGHLGAASEVIDLTLDMAAISRTPPSTGALISGRIIAAVLAWGRGDLDRAEPLLDLALEDCLATGDERRLAITRAFLGHVARDRGDFDTATAQHDEAARLYDESDSDRGSAWARFDLGRVAWQRGDLEGAAALLRDALSRFRDLGYPWAVGWTSWALGNVNVELGALADGALMLGSALSEFDTVGDLRGVAMCWESLAAVAASRGRHAEALHLLGAASTLRKRIESPVTTAEQVRITGVERSAREALGDYRTDREQQAGRTLPVVSAQQLARAVAEAIAASAERKPAPETDDEAVEALTPREREVARLVAAGLTNQQIGTRLGITSRTAEAHLHNIRSKLDARSRSEVAAWAAIHGLGPTVT